MAKQVSQILDEFVLIFVKYLFTLFVEAVCGKLILHPTAIGNQGLGCITAASSSLLTQIESSISKASRPVLSVGRSESWKGCYCSLQIGHGPMEHLKHRLN